MKHAVACALLIIGSAMFAAPAFADPVMPPPVTDDTPAPPAAEPNAAAPAPDPVFPKPASVSEKPSPVSDKSVPPPACADCPPPKRYDSEEVIRKIREIDKSRVISTAETAPVYAPKRPEGGIRVRSDKTLVVFVTHEYRVIESPGLVSASDVGPPPRYGSYRPHRMACQYGRDRYGHHCRAPLRVRD